MHKFVRGQMIQSLSAKVKDVELLDLVPTKESRRNIITLSRCVKKDNELLKLLELAYGNLNVNSHTYEDCGSFAT